VLLVVKEVVTTTEEVTTEVVVAPAGTGTEGVMTQMETGTEVVLTQAEMATAVPEIETVAPAEDVGRALAPRGGRAKASGRAASRKTASGAAGVSEGPGEEASGMEQAAGASAEDHAVNGGDNVGLPAEGTVRPWPSLVVLYAGGGRLASAVPVLVLDSLRREEECIDWGLTYIHEEVLEESWGPAVLLYWSTWHEHIRIHHMRRPNTVCGALFLAITVMEHCLADSLVTWWG
jgi:hypothetical protein